MTFRRHGTILYGEPPISGLPLKALVLIGSLLLLAAAPAHDEVRLRYFNVAEQGSDFLLSWETEVEESARSFEVQRRTAFSNGQYLVAEEFQPHGVNRLYEYKDDQVFKAGAGPQDVVDYRLVVVYESGARQILASKSVNYTSTALRRTWGSIKAMF